MDRGWARGRQCDTSTASPTRLASVLLASKPGPAPPPWKMPRLNWKRGWMTARSVPNVVSARRSKVGLACQPLTSCELAGT